MNFEQMIGFGVAGNFAGHLEQAGEAADFTQVKTENAIQPKAIFPFYVPSENAGFLSIFPLSHNQINFPQGADNLLNLLSFIDQITNKRNFRFNLKIICTLWKVNLIVT